MFVLLWWCWIAVAWGAPSVELEAWLSNQPKSGVGTLVVQMSVPDGVDVQWPEPTVQGLRFTETGDPQSERFGDKVVIRRSFRFSGKPGHYEIPPLTVDWKSEEGARSVSSRSIFFDLEKDPLRTGELSDIAEPASVWTLPGWVKWAVGALLFGLGALVGAGLLLRRVNAAPVPVVIDPPDVVALRAWEAACADQTLADYDKAVEISRIFRVYTEAALGFAATAWTTREILEHLGNMTHLKSGNVPRAKRLLRATDRIKYADASAVAELFDDLDSDLRGFVGSTRPVKWGETP